MILTTSSIGVHPPRREPWKCHRPLVGSGAMKVRHPKPKRKHGRQSIRLTRNGFALHGGRLYVAKVGDIKIEWSRGLPSVPSSVTVIREPDGRYYASFVVQREAMPLPACDREV